MTDVFLSAQSEGIKQTPRYPLAVNEICIKSLYHSRLKKKNK